MKKVAIIAFALSLLIPIDSTAQTPVLVSRPVVTTIMPYPNFRSSETDTKRDKIVVESKMTVKEAIIVWILLLLISVIISLFVFRVIGLYRNEEIK